MDDGSKEYLVELHEDRWNLSQHCDLLKHCTRIIDREIENVKLALFFNESQQALKNSQGDRVLLQEKIFVPIEQFPNYNFVGRLLGPRGMTAKQLEQVTGCKIMVRGKGSSRKQRKKSVDDGIEEELHVIVQCTDVAQRVTGKLEYAVSVIKEMLTPPMEGEDELKRKQLMQLAIINGTYRPSTKRALTSAPQHLLGTPMSLLSTMDGDGRGNAEWPSPSSRVQDVQSAFSAASITDYIRELQRCMAINWALGGLAHVPDYPPS